MKPISALSPVPDALPCRGIVAAAVFFSSRRRHTRLQDDWSSDVCSSDLGTTPSDSTWRGSCAYADPRERVSGCRQSITRRRPAEDADASWPAAVGWRDGPLRSQDLETSLPASTPESPPPDWVPLLLEGAWQRALIAFGGDAPERIQAPRRPACRRLPIHTWLRSTLEPYEDQYIGAAGDGGGRGRRQLAAVSRPPRQRRGDRFPAGRMECGVGEKHPLEDRHPRPRSFQPRDLGRPH